MPLTQKTVLFVEDDIASLETLAQMAEALNAAHVFRARSGTEALNALKFESIDIVVTDLHMRGGSGPDLIEAIRSGEAGEDHRNCKILVLTGDKRAAVQRMIDAAGADGFVVKPVRIGELSDAFEKILSH